MTDTPRDDVTSDDLREQLAQAAQRTDWPVRLSPYGAGVLVDAILPVVAEHIAREVQTALAEQREQIVAALRGFDCLEGPVPGHIDVPDDYEAGVHAAADMIGQMSDPAPDVWDDSVPPGGYVCAVCRIPTESEPCEEHQAHADDEMGQP